jgi:hypothetical protein
MVEMVRLMVDFIHHLYRFTVGGTRQTSLQKNGKEVKIKYCGPVSTWSQVHHMNGPKKWKKIWQKCIMNKQVYIDTIRFKISFSTRYRPVKFYRVPVVKSYGFHFYFLVLFYIGWRSEAKKDKSTQVKLSKPLDSHYLVKTITSKE